jgi:hypothetical protein
LDVADASDAVEVEEFSTEYEALGRARELLEDGDHGGVSVRDSSGNVLCGVRLQLKLGFSANKGAGHDARSKPAMGARISPHLVALKLD